MVVEAAVVVVLVAVVKVVLFVVVVVMAAAHLSRKQRWFVRVLTVLAREPGVHDHT